MGMLAADARQMKRDGSPLNRAIRMFALTGSAAAVLAVLPATAGAAYVSPTAIDFGNVPVGTTSGPQQVLLSADCTSIPTSPCATALLGDFVNVAPSTSGEFGYANGCPAGLSPSPATGVTESCAINVTFSPSGIGARVGALNTGTLGPGGLLPAPMVQLSGTGVAGAAGFSSPGKKTRKRCRHHKKKQHSLYGAKKKCKKKRR
jgi:hypothetical protein